MPSDGPDGHPASEAGKEELREVIKRSEKGAPEADRAVGDIFTTDEIFHRIVATADEEFSVSVRLLFLSGLPPGHTGLLDALLYLLGFTLNYAQTRDKFFSDYRALSWKEWLT